jgi:hypothetical protein
MIYEQQEGEQLHYVIKERISQNFECSLMVICTNHIILCHVNCLPFSLRNVLSDVPYLFIYFFLLGKKIAVGELPRRQGTRVDAGFTRALHKNRRWTGQQRRSPARLEEWPGVQNLFG